MSNTAKFLAAVGFACAALAWAALAEAGEVNLRSAKESGDERIILVVGDSLSAAFGVPLEQGWVALLERRLQSKSKLYRVHNASVSGDTTRGGLERIDSLLERLKPSIVLLELGGNDGLRGLSLSATRENLSAMVRKSLAARAKVILLGVYLPPNLGPVFNDRFKQIFVDLSDEFDVPLVPFLLEGIGGVSELMQADGIHPTTQAQPIMLDNVWPVLEPELD